MPDLRTTRRAACIAMCLTVTLSAQTAATKKKAKAPRKPAPVILHLDHAYFGGELVKFHSVPVSGARPLVVGPWNLGPKVTPKPNDKRPNLYFVSPGTQHHVDGRPEYDHNEVLSAVPKSTSDFDVWWVLVLDPSVKEDFTSEQQIILATQQTFEPGEDFSFDDIPSAGFLRSFLKVHTLVDLERYRRPDGELPRVAIVRAGFAVRAQAEEIEESQTAESGEE